MPEENKSVEPKPESEKKETAEKASKKIIKPSYRKKKAAKKFVTRAIVNILATYNNTLVTFTDPEGNVLANSSAGRCGFAGPKKSTPYAAGIIVKSIMDKVRDFGVKEVDVRIKGVGSGREGAIRALNAQGLSILSIKDVTPIPHNGPRPPKVRRV
ncbi:MAG: 30S ribosomal protein S11 [Patescibacteria group bacterium]|nr:30S ribosomal protein S11 [Patescibacteria group bacterium]